MNILGYSERGIVNSLFYEIAYSSDPTTLLHTLLSEAEFPFVNSPPPQGRADVLIEQSFSHFGESDALVLIDAEGPRRCSIFIEAKVMTGKRYARRIAGQFANFRKQLNDDKVKSSNLFAQLFHKQMLVQALHKGGLQLLQRGVHFPSWSKKRFRKIGRNKVVLEATRRLQDHLDEVFYLAIVPDKPSDIAEDFKKIRDIPHPSVAESWDASTYGYLTWDQIRTFCRKHELQKTLCVFDYNTDQICH